MVTLIHLSDIHFSRIGSAAYDLDQDVRDQLLADVRLFRDSNQGQITGAVITGDIAFSGQAAEFERAKVWLQQLVECGGFEPDKVWITPGNHDSDRAVHRSSMPLKHAFEKLRECEDHSIDELVKSYAEDATYKTELYRPLAEYNNFALQYGCTITAENPFWESHIELGAGRTLCIRGLNSVLVSSAADSDRNDNTKMILPLGQCTLLQRDNIVYLTLCHHPTNWFRNMREVEATLNARAHLQLFGHEHESWQRNVNGKQQIFAGALGPERTPERRSPHYNMISLSIVESHENSRLQIRTYARTYDRNNRRFQTTAGTGFLHQDFFVEIPQINNSANTSVRAEASMSNTLGGSGQPVEQQHNSVNFESAVKKLLYFLVSLPFPDRMEVVKELNLLLPEDENVPDIEKHQRFLSRAKEQNKLSEFWDAVVEKIPGTHPSNPFRNRQDRNGVPR